MAKQYKTNLESRKKHTLPRVLCALSCVLAMHAVTLAPSTSWAQLDPELMTEEERAVEVSRLSNEAATAFKEKNFDEAIRLFEEAYNIEPVPLLQYNIGRCYEKKKEWEKAIEHYEQYAVAAGVSSAERKGALQRIKKIRKEQGLEASNNLKNNDANNAKNNSTTNNTSNNTSNNTTKNPSTGPGALAYVVLTGGVLMLAGGGVTGYLAYNESTKFEQAENIEDLVSAQQNGRTFSLVADGLFIAGGVTTLIGLIMVLSGGDESQNASNTTTPKFSPLFAPGFSGVHMSWSF